MTANKNPNSRFFSGAAPLVKGSEIRLDINLPDTPTVVISHNRYFSSVSLLERVLFRIHLNN